MKCVIIGAGKYGEVYLSFLSEAGFEIIGFLDDDPKEMGNFIQGIPVLGPTTLMDSIQE